MKSQTPNTKLGPRPQGWESKRSADNFGHCYLFAICHLEFLLTPADFRMKEGRQEPPLDVAQSRVLRARILYCLVTSGFRL